MKSTASGAKKETIIFISDAHEKFYYEKLKKVRYQDEYHKALVYCLGINSDTRKNINRKAFLTMRIQRNSWTNTDSTLWKNCFAVPMHLIFGRQYKSVIQHMRPIITICKPYLEDKMNVKIIFFHRNSQNFLVLLHILRFFYH